MKPLLLIDLDRTLFDTDKFSNYVAFVLANTSGKSKDFISKLLIRYSDGENNHLRHTNFSALLKELGVNQRDAEQAILHDVPPNSLLLPDVPEFLKWLKTQNDFEPRILSFGQTTFQKLKLTTSPDLSWIEADIILKRKNSYISSTFYNRNGFLIDDKPHQQLPNGWTEVTIHRLGQTSQKARIISDSVWEITTLMQIKDIHI